MLSFKCLCFFMNEIQNIYCGRSILQKENNWLFFDVFKKDNWDFLWLKQFKPILLGICYEMSPKPTFNFFKVEYIYIYILYFKYKTCFICCDWQHIIHIYHRVTQRFRKCPHWDLKIYVEKILMQFQQFIIFRILCF